MKVDDEYRAHNPKVAASNSAPATNEKAQNSKGFRAFKVFVIGVATCPIWEMSNLCQTREVVLGRADRVTEGPRLKEAT